MLTGLGRNPLLVSRDHGVVQLPHMEGETESGDQQWQDCTLYTSLLSSSSSLLTSYIKLPGLSLTDHFL